MDLEIKYEHGSMVIHLENFLDCRNISKVKKLVKIIRNSFTPECEDKIREYVEQEIEQFEPKQQENQRYIIGYTEKVKFCQKQLDNALYNRNQYKKSTPLHKSDGWEHYNCYVPGSLILIKISGIRNFTRKCCKLSHKVGEKDALQRLC